MPTPAAHPLAKPGYGKRSAPDQQPPRPDDFGHLPPREAYLASLLDQLCENAAMDAKTIAKAQPLYGQQAVRSAFNELSRAGHLRRIRRRIETGEGESGTRWVFHTYWSRTARDNEWWARFLDADSGGGPVSEAVPSDVTPQPEPLHPHGDTRPSMAYVTLAQLGLQDPRLALTSADCAALEQSAANWLARGITPDHLTQILVAGLPEQVHSPGAFVRRRLIDKLPPERPASSEPRAPRTLVECTDCGVPGRPEALPGGLCRACDGRGAGIEEGPVRMRPAAVRARATQVRASIRTPARV
ncbi:hypothetical protein [Streptomyces sp. KR55]|uniref:hypothetical protein n=1 Tax=Streptomyces sp. KR55 TaxID=3457425 RepID=UPI003FD21383